MPHTKTGREVKIGDQIISVQDYGNGNFYSVAGTVVSISESETCNAQIVPLGLPTAYITLKDAIHISDLGDFKKEEKPVLSYPNAASTT